MDTVHEEALAAAGTRADGTIDISAALSSPQEGLLNAVMDEQASELGVRATAAASARSTPASGG